MYDLNSNNPNPIISYDGVNKNIASVGFHEDGRWMYTGGEDCTARIWDLRCLVLGWRGWLPGEGAGQGIVFGAGYSISRLSKAALSKWLRKDGNEN